jgi:hypothetical protein
MQREADKIATIEAAKALDSLAALSIRLSCQCNVAPETLVLKAAHVREACEAIDDAVDALKRILAVTDASGASIHVQSAGGEPPRMT